MGVSDPFERDAVEIRGEVVLSGAQPRVGIGRGLVAQRDPLERLKGDRVAGNHIYGRRQGHGALIDRERAGQRGFVEGNRPRHRGQVDGAFQNAVPQVYRDDVGDRRRRIDRGILAGQVQRAGGLVEVGIQALHAGPIPEPPASHDELLAWNDAV